MPATALTTPRQPAATRADLDGRAAGNSRPRRERRCRTGVRPDSPCRAWSRPAWSPFYDPIVSGQREANNNPLDQVDPLGLRPTDDDLSLARPDIDALQQATGGLPGWAGDPFGLAAGVVPWLARFDPWHNAVRDDLPRLVGGFNEWNPLCAIPGGGLNGGIGRADVCTATEVWEVKYFGEQGLQAAIDQLERYRPHDTAGPDGRPRVPGHLVPPSIVSVAGMQVLSFSPAPGVRLYMPVPWFPVLARSPARAELFQESVTVEELLGALAEAGMVPDWVVNGGGGGIHLPDFDTPDWVPGGLLGTVIVGACLAWLCGTPLPGPI